MSEEHNERRDLRVTQAIAELEQTIRNRYPTAQFTVSQGEDEPENIHLFATVDVADPDEVTDLVLERLVHLQVEERIPIYVVPVRTAERILAAENTSNERERGHLRLMRDLVSPPPLRP